MQNRQTINLCLVGKIFLLLNMVLKPQKILSCVSETFFHSRTTSWPSVLKHRFYDNYDLKIDASTPTQTLLLRPWIKCFTIILSLVESNKQQTKEVRSKIQAENSETKAALDQVMIRPMQSTFVAFLGQEDKKKVIKSI